MKSPPAKKKVSDIARAVGVSPGTVSNALNNRRGVSAEKRAQILEVAREMGYWHGASRGKSPGNRVLRFLAFDRFGYVGSNTQFYYEFIEGMNGECRKLGYELLISHITEQDFDGIQNLGGAAGLLLLATELFDRDLEHFRLVQKPLVLVDGYFPDCGWSAIQSDNQTALYTSTSYLISRGHRRIGFLGSHDGLSIYEGRHQGYLLAMEENGLTVDPADELLVSVTMEAAHEAVSKKLRDRHWKPPTAIAAVNDVVAIGAMRAFQEAGCRVPEDVSIIGLDNISMCEASTPRLTSVTLHHAYMGAMAVKQLVDIIESGEERRLRIMMTPELVERDSVRTIK